MFPKLLLSITLLSVLTIMTVGLPYSVAQDGGLADKAYDEWELVEIRDLRPDLEIAVQAELPEYKLNSRNTEGLPWLSISYASLAPAGNDILLGLKMRSTNEENNKENSGLCHYEIDTQITKCHILSEYADLDNEELISWSPDGRYAIFHRDFLDHLQNSDLWLFDTQTGTTRNLTPDDDPGRGSSSLDIMAMFILTGRWYGKRIAKPFILYGISLLKLKLALWMSF